MSALALLCSGFKQILPKSQTAISGRCLAAASIHTSSSNSSTLGEAIQYLRFKFYHDIRHHLDEDKWCKIFAVEGNIKSGKGAFGADFAKELDLRFFPSCKEDYHFTRLVNEIQPEKMAYLLQPDSIQNRVWNFSLEKALTSPEDWQHLGRFQIAMQTSRFYLYADAMSHLLRTCQGVVVERSIFGNEVFRHAFRKMKWIDKRLFEYMNKLFRRQSNMQLPPQVVLYLDVSPEQCYENIKANGTPAEKHITLDYLKAIQEAYEEHYLPSAEENGSLVVRLDWSKPKKASDIAMDLDEYPILLAEFNKWDRTNEHLKGLLRHNSDDDILEGCATEYCNIEELWDPDWSEVASYILEEGNPWYYKIGYDPKKDKNIWLKE